jgi:hypothetical protein
MNSAEKPMECDDSEQQKVKKRMHVVRRELCQYDSNIALLKAFNEGKMMLKGKKYTHRAENYQQTLEDKARLPRTLANLAIQRGLLERELQTLREYCA